MRWEGGRRSSNIEDRRGRGVSRGVIGGGAGALLLAVIAMLFGVDPGAVIEGQPANGVPGTDEPYTESAEEQQMREFVSVVLGDTEDTWNALFQRMNAQYEEPVLVLFSGAVESACGYAQAAVGPFYCPADHKVYLDMSFFADMEQQLQASGDFAQAYVIAHEVGHHVQTLLGISQQVNGMRGRVSQEEANALSVRQELQADCFAGLWGYHANRTRQILESGDVEEALNAASAIGDDRLQRQSQGYVVPESFTHGSSAQRVRWFRRGIETGDVNQCDTFSQEQL
jgi:predicted metalloprotease